jgi:parallel beta-helix repeat protein
MLSLTVLPFSNLSYANYFPDPGPDLPRIYITSNGSVEPATAPIERAGNIYKLTNDIMLCTVEIQRDNVVLDGNGYLIQGNASWLGYDAGNNGVIMSNCKNVTVTGLNFEACYSAVKVIGSSNVTVVGNLFSDSNNKGVVLQGSSFCLVADNTFNHLRTDINAAAINVNGANNTIKNNNLTGSTYGIQITGVSNLVSDNLFESVLPIRLDSAQSNIISSNKLSGPAGQKGGEGIALFVNCSNNLFFNNSITGFHNQAIRFVFNAENNTVYGNYFKDNEFAVVIQESAINNLFYGNTFEADSCNVSVFEVQNTFWDNGTIGNYWSNYQGADINGDGIGDTPYALNGYVWNQTVDGFVSTPSGQDNYPLMAPYDIENQTVTPTPSLLPIILPVLGATLAAGAGLLVYFKKYKCK